MYLSAPAILKAIQILREEVHPFVGITFLACKHAGLSIGTTDDVSVDSLTRVHLDTHHRIDRRSSHYFQPFKSSSWWVSQKYPSSGLQTSNTQTFKSVFIHPRKTQKWGFEVSYLERMRDILQQDNAAFRIPADALAVWVFKSANLEDISNYEDLVEKFFSEYNITVKERSLIFSARAMEKYTPANMAFVAEPLEMTVVTSSLPPPPDAEAEGGRTITTLHLRNAGPAREMRLDFGRRLTIVTGDNGLGKSFLLDFAWWAAIGHWPDRPMIPSHRDTKTIPTIDYTLTGASGRLSNFSAKYDWSNLLWRRPHDAMTVEAVAVFSRADGSFAVSDPVRSKFNQDTTSTGKLSAHEVWNGRDGFLEGLIRDWLRWQTSNDRKAFDQFSLILKRLSPDDLGELTPGDPIRLPGEPREIPTIKHRYGTVPVTQASSGVQRVLLLSYLIIWSWREHELAARSLGRSPLRRMLLIVDELEAHLHPKWQRIVLPALMGVGDLLSSDLALQTIAATHSPMILASMETTFSATDDLLYHLYVDGPMVSLEEVPFIKYGDASAWLTSPLFGLRHARSQDAESAIEAAKALQLEAEPSTIDVRNVSERLKRYLSSDDKFWPRWLYFAEQHGVEI
ncbi:MAG: AAA family ATPase [Proteobacteria bacterium]|nr:AAA family ATPase [Pseudomonadota bacterium]